MKKITIILFSVFFILFINLNVHAQLIKVGVGGGLTQVLSSDAFTNEVSSGGLGYSSEYNLGVIAKIDIPILPITPRGFILFHNLNGSGNYSKITNEQAKEVKYSQSITSIGIGVQLSIIPIPVGVDPYLSLDITFNNFKDFNGTPPNGFLTFNGSRGGLQLGIGAEVTIIPMINLDIIAGYNWFNLTGKVEGEETLSSVNLDLFFMFNFL